MFSFPPGDEPPVLYNMELEPPLAWPKVAGELKSPKAGLDTGVKGNYVGAVEGVVANSVMGMVRGWFVCLLSQAISS